MIKEEEEEKKKNELHDEEQRRILFVPTKILRMPPHMTKNKKKCDATEE